VGHAWIDGSPVATDAAVAQAARLLRAARLPLIAGLGTDIAGARAAIALAQRLGGVIDHMHSDPVLRDLDGMREAGMIMTTPNEARLRADTVLVAGAGLLASADVAASLLMPPTAREIGPGAARRVFWLCPGRTKAHAADADIQTIGRRPGDLPALLAAVRARLAGRPLRQPPIPARTLDALAADLQRARFGVAVWSAAELDAPTIEMLCGLIDDLNVHTRFTGLPLAAADNALGVLQACAWSTALPMRTGFGRGFPEHDPWRFNAIRLVETGEADCVLWISSYSASIPEWTRDVPLIALTQRNARCRRARVHVEVARPGIDHDAVEHFAMIGTLASVTATEPNDTITVAQAISRIARALPDVGSGHADAH
jgi:formylmethanofuran dehydrogenase subunit B